MKRRLTEENGKRRQAAEVDRGAAYATGLFLLINICLNIDRSIPVVVMEPVKRAFHLKDSQLGLLSLGFAFFFGLASIPLGRIADSGARRLGLVVSVAFFSLMTGAGGLAQNLTQLLVTRFAVGAGEAGGGPAMLSMLSDLAPPERRASAISILYLGLPLGFIITVLGGGWLAGHLGWRAVFATAAVPGIILAVVAFFTLKEPARGRYDVTGDTGPSSGPDSIRFLLKMTAFRHLMVTTLITSALTAGVVTWSVSFLVRSYGLGLPKAGLVMAFAYGGAGVAGAYLGGWATERLARRDVRWRAWSIGVFSLAAAPALAAFLLAPTLLTATLALAAWSVVTVAIYAPAAALVQNLAPPRMRGMAAASFYLVTNFLGVGIGPLLVGIISDRLAPGLGRESLRYALMAMTLGFVWASLHYYLAGRSLKRDFQTVADYRAGAPSRGSGSPDDLASHQSGGDAGAIEIK